jgi:hypothetical protein
MTTCPSCGHASPDPTSHPCPVCDGALATTAAASPADPVRRYLRTLWALHAHPARFFRAMPTEGGLSGPLAFALTTHWIGESVGFLWRTALSDRVMSRMSAIFQVAGDVMDVDSPGRGATMAAFRDRIVHWAWGAGRVIIDPFWTLAGLLFVSFFVYVGARLLVTPGEDGDPRAIRYETALRIVCYGTAPAILAAIPLAGEVIPLIAVPLLTIVGAREVYRIPPGRAVVVALFPSLLKLATIMAGLGLILVALLRFVFSAF